MQIDLSFDETLMRLYEARGSPIPCGISITHECLIYPMAGWIDFGPVILNWWLFALGELLSGARCRKLLFMDGPYAVAARFRRRTKTFELQPQGLDVTWDIPAGEVVEAVAGASERVANQLRRLEIGGAQQANLECAAGELREAMLHLGIKQK